MLYYSMGLCSALLLFVTVGLAGLRLSLAYNYVWSQVQTAPSTGFQYMAMDITGQYVYAVPYNGGRNYGPIYNSQDFGNSWSATSTSVTAYSIACDDSGQRVVATSGASVLLSSDRRANFTTIASIQNCLNLYTISSDSTGQYLAMGCYPNNIYVSHNFGYNWTYITILSMGWLASLKVSGSGKGTKLWRRRSFWNCLVKGSSCSDEICNCISKGSIFSVIGKILS